MAKQNYGYAKRQKELEKKKKQEEKRQRKLEKNRSLDEEIAEDSNSEFSINENSKS